MPVSVRIIGLDAGPMPGTRESKRHTERMSIIRMIEKILVRSEKTRDEIKIHFLTEHESLCEIEVDVRLSGLDICQDSIRDDLARSIAEYFKAEYRRATVEVNVENVGAGHGKGHVFQT